MARYAEWNKFIGNLKTDKYGETTVNEVGIAFEKATADVVPKSEVEALKVLLEMNEKAYESLKELYHTDTDALVNARKKTETEV